MPAQFGQATQLVGGTLQLKLPERVVFWYIQNQSPYPMKVTFLGSEWGSMGAIILNPGLDIGFGGGYMDSIGFPYFSTEGVQLDSSNATAQFGSGASPNTPNNVFSYPGTGPQQFG